jgi:rhomboid protease GluP
MRITIEEVLRPILIEPEINRYGEGEIKTFHSKNNNSNSSNSYSNKNLSHRKYSRSRYFTIFNTLIILINCILFLVLEKNGSTTDTEYMLNNGAMFWPYVVNYKEYYRLFTYMFLHFGIQHLANNMIVLAFIGDNLERATGKIRYILIYLGSGVIAGVTSMGYNMLQNNNVVAVGASGAIFGVVGSMLYIVIVNRGRLEDISSGQLILFAFFSIYSGFTSQEIDNVAHIAGFIAGILITALIYSKPKKREVY